MARLFLILILIVILLAVPVKIGLNYLNTTYLPEVVKTKIVEEASDKLNLDVQIGSMEFDIFKGIILRDIVITSNDSPDTSLEIQRIQTTFLLLPIFKEKKIIFPSLEIFAPKFEIVHEPDNQFNIQNLIPKQMPVEEEASAYSFLIYKIDILNADIGFLDKTLEPNLRHNLKVKSSRLQIYPWGADFILSGDLLGEKQTNTLNLTGSFKFDTKELKVSVLLDKLNIVPYLVYFPAVPVNINSLILDNLKAEFSAKEGILNITTEADLANGDIMTKAYLVKDETILTNANAKIRADFTPDPEDKTVLNYSFSVDELKADLIAPQIPDKVKITYAKLDISPDRIDIKNAAVNTLQTEFFIKGTLENFSDLRFDLKVNSQIDLPTAKDFFRTYFDFIDPFIVHGRAGLNINLSNSQSDKGLQFNGTIDLENASLKTLNFPYEATFINGTINFQENKADWTNLSFMLLDKLFYSKAAISNFGLPLIDLELYSDKLNLRTGIITKNKNSFKIEYLNSSYYGSKLDLNGDMKIDEENNYYVDLILDSIFDLKDLKQISGLPQEAISELNAKGRCKIAGQIQGNLFNTAQLNTILNISSPEIVVRGLKLDDLKMQVVQEDRQIKIPESSCQFYEGTLSLNGLVDLEKDGLPFAAKLLVENVNLEKLKLDIPLNDDKLKGTIFSTVILSGALNTLPDFKSQGEFIIQNGYLWGFNPLKKLGDFLFIPKYETLVFKEANGLFSILNKNIALENVVLTSEALLLSCEGTIDFKGNLDLDITPKAVTDMTENLDEFEKFFAGIFSESGGLATVKITGTVQEPKYEKKIIAMQVIDKMKNQVVDKVKSFTDLIFGSAKENP